MKHVFLTRAHARTHARTPTGSGRAARHAALTSLFTTPAMWVIVAALLIEPHSQVGWVGSSFQNPKQPTE